MKNNICFPFLHDIGFHAIFLTFFILSGVSAQSQKATTQKGYGDAIYQGLQDDIFLKKWLSLTPFHI